MKFLAALMVLITTSVFAVEIKVAETPVDFFRPEARAAFAVNQSMGRAWIELEMYDSRGNGEVGNGSVVSRHKVEGLVFNAATSTIALTHEGQLFECATVSRRWYGTRINPTGCELKIRKVKLTVDDGYNSYKRDFFQVHLKTK